MNDYVLAQSWARPNIQDRTWYCMEEDDKDLLKSQGKVSFGDKAYIIKTKTTYIMGNDNTWYVM